MIKVKYEKYNDVSFYALRIDELETRIANFQSTYKLNVFMKRRNKTDEDKKLHKTYSEENALTFIKILNQQLVKEQTSYKDAVMLQHAPHLNTDDYKYDLSRNK